MRQTRQLILILFIFMCSKNSYSQVTLGARFSGHNAYFLASEEGDDDYSLSSMGAGPYFGLESKRFIMQMNYTVYGKINSLQFRSTAYQKGVELKPNELGMIFGFKINANKPLKVYPFIGLNKYTIKLKYTEVAGSTSITYEDQFNYFGPVLGIGSYYEYNNFVFDLQAKFSPEYARANDNAVNFFIGFGVGYKLKLKEEPAKKEKVSVE